MRHLLLAVMLLSLGAGAAIAKPKVSDKDAAAKAAYEEATKAYNLGKFDKAIEAYERAYDLKPDPVFLFNIAQSHNKAGRPEKALEYYRRYLNDAPTAPNHGEVTEIVAELEKQIAPKPQITALETYPVEVASEPAPKGFVAKPERAPISKKTWFIIAGVAGGAVVLGTAIGLGVYFGTRGPTVTVFNPVSP